MAQKDHQERTLRRRLQKAGYALHKSRAKSIYANDFGGYMIVDVRLNAVVGGGKFDFDLEDVEDFVQKYA